MRRNRVVPRKGVTRTLEGVLTEQLVGQFLGGVRRYFVTQVEHGAYGVACQPAGSAGPTANGALRS